MPVAPGLPIILPEYVEGQRAWQETVRWTINPLGARWLYRASGAIIEIPITIFYAITTEATAGNRFANLSLRDDQNNIVWFTQAEVAQPASTTYSYTWSALLSAVISTANGVYVLPFTPGFLAAGWFLQADIANPQALDTIAAPYMQVMRFMTGGERDQSVEAIAAPLDLETPAALPAFDVTPVLPGPPGFEPELGGAQPTPGPTDEPTPPPPPPPTPAPAPGATEGDIGGALKHPGLS